MYFYAYQDNQSTLRIVNTGKAPQLRHVSRTHGVDIGLCWEQTKAKNCIALDCVTHVQAADIFTKFFPNWPKWYNACMLIGVVPPEIHDKLIKIKEGGAIVETAKVAKPNIETAKVEHTNTIKKG